jgi:RNA polymerase primary sigma factor
MTTTRITRADELELTRRYRKSLAQGTPDLEARDALLDAHMGMIEAAAALLRLTNKRHVETRELVHEGCCGFYQGLDRFDPEKGNRVSTYCLYYVKNAMHQHIRDIRFNDYVGEDDYRLLMKMNSEMAKQPMRFNGSVEIADVAAILKISERQCHELFTLTRSFFPLEMGLSRNGDLKLLNVLPADKDARTEEFIAAQEELAALIDEGLSHLSEAQREAVKSYYLHRPYADYYEQMDSGASHKYDPKDRQQGVRKLRSSSPIKKAYLLMQTKLGSK